MGETFAGQVVFKGLVKIPDPDVGESSYTAFGKPRGNSSQGTCVTVTHSQQETISGVCTMYKTKDDYSSSKGSKRCRRQSYWYRGHPCEKDTCNRSPGRARHAETKSSGTSTQGLVAQTVPELCWVNLLYSTPPARNGYRMRWRLSGRASSAAGWRVGLLPAFNVNRFSISAVARSRSSTTSPALSPLHLAWVPASWRHPVTALFPVLRTVRADLYSRGKLPCPRHARGGGGGLIDPHRHAITYFPPSPGARDRACQAAVIPLWGLPRLPLRLCEKLPSGLAATMW